jgi:hypothetical protein
MATGKTRRGMTERPAVAFLTGQSGLAKGLIQLSKSALKFDGGREQQRCRCRAQRPRGPGIENWAGALCASYPSGTA